MRRTTPLTATAVLGLALLAPTASASAAGETCRGEAATLVGTSDTLTGTPGRDVIVTGSATDVDTLSGDDLICVVPDGTRSNVLDVIASSGDDVVDTTGASSSYYVSTDLGQGSDILEGGDAGDWVVTDSAVGGQEAIDVVRANGGNDSVRTSGASDVIDLGPGTNLLWLQGRGTTPEGRLTGGAGYDTFKMTVPSSPSAHVFDMAAGTYRTEGASALFSSFESLDLDARGARVEYVGTEADDYLNVETAGPEPSTVVAAMLGGDDNLTVDRTRLDAGTRIDLGSGHDRLVAARTTGSLALDLERGTLRAKNDSFPLAGIEDGFLMARRVSLVGNAEDNTLSGHACTTQISGGRGDDELVWQGDYVFEEYSYSCTKTATMRGGPGEDSFYGSPGNDRLLGDGDQDTIRGSFGDDRILGGKGADRITGERGRDFADGGKGRDRCSAERERTCER